MVSPLIYIIHKNVAVRPGLRGKEAKPRIDEVLGPIKVSRTDNSVKKMNEFFCFARQIISIFKIFQTR